MKKPAVAAASGISELASLCNPIITRTNGGYVTGPVIAQHKENNQTAVFGYP